MAARRHLVLLAKAASGIAVIGGLTFHLATRKCYFEPIGPETFDSLFKHPLLKLTNPWNKPASCDSCVREIAFGHLDKAVLDDAARGGTMLIERFTAGMWGGYGYAIQRNIMSRFQNATNMSDLWSKEELLKSAYEPGTYFTNHFIVLSKAPTCITMRGCFDPHQTSPSPMTMDSLVEIHAYLDDRRKVAVLKLRTSTFNGKREASEKEDPFGGVGGWLHRRYSTLLVDSGARNCLGRQAS